MALSNAERERIYDRIAQMTFSQIANRDIALHLGIKESQVSEIKNGEEYNKFVAREFSNNHDNPELAHAQAARSNVLYDRVEVMALKNIAAALEWNQDPDLALRVARMANGATRRGRAVEADTGGSNVVHITFNQAYVTTIQKADASDARRELAASVIDAVHDEPAGIVKHEHDTVTEKQAQEFLAEAYDAAHDVTKINFDGIDLADVEVEA